MRHRSETETACRRPPPFSGRTSVAVVRRRPEDTGREVSGPASGLSRRRTLTIGGAAARTNPRGALTGTRDARWKTQKENKERPTAALAARSLPKDWGGGGSQARTSSQRRRRRGQRTGPTSSNVIPQRAAQGPRGRRAFRTPDGARATSLVATGLLHVRGRIQLILLAAFQILPTSPC